MNDETYAICKSDMMIKGKDPEHIRVGSTLSTDEFAGTSFDFMLSNPPYGKSWSSEQKYIKDGKEVIDPRFIIRLKDYWGEEDDADATPRSSDGQLLFLMEMINKMKSVQDNILGSRIASVHNGSSLFTGDAGGGESNIRRYIIENDLLEAIIQLPENLFYNTGITTYIWLLSNNKAANRKGKVQLIDASQMFVKLRKNLGNKNCKLDEAQIATIARSYDLLSESEKQGSEVPGSLVFNNEDFGYYKVNIERPKRLRAQFSEENISVLKWDKKDPALAQWLFEQYGEEVYHGLTGHKTEILKQAEKEELAVTAKQLASLLKDTTWKAQRASFEAAQKLMEIIGTEVYMDFNLFSEKLKNAIKKTALKLSSSEQKQIIDAVTVYDEKAEKVIKKTLNLKGEKLKTLLEHLGCSVEELPHFGYYPTEKPHEYVQYDTETDLRDSENIPLKEQILDYYLREVKPYSEDSWIDLDSVKIGYELSFNKYFYQPEPLRSLDAVTADILELQKQGEGLMDEILKL